MFTNLLDHAGPDIAHLLHWSRWPRRHQARARDYHHRRFKHPNSPDHELGLE
jgi:hypothetical protein